MTVPAPLPSCVPLGGVDAVMVAMADGMRREVGHDASCRVVLTLDGFVDPDPLVMRLKRSPTWRWLTSWRLGRGPGRWPAWCVDPSAPEVPLRLLHAPDEAELVAALDGDRDPVGDPRRTPLLRLDLYHVGVARSVLVLTFHHAAFDARGAELLLAAVLDGTLDDLDATALFGDPPARGPLWPRVWSAKAARDHLFRVAWPPLAFLGSRRLGVVSAPSRGRRVLDAEAMARADAVAASVGASMTRSALHLAVTAGAVAALLARQGRPRGDLLVPMPQDRRRRGAKGPVLGNRISTMFLRLPRALCDRPDALVADIQGQLRDRMASGLLDAYLTLLDLCRGLPGWLMRALMRLPTLGRVATFGFSDTGASLDRFDAVGGVPVAEARHLPANLAPPGLTVVFSRDRGRLTVCATWLPGALSHADAEALLDDIVARLVGDA